MSLTISYASDEVFLFLNYATSNTASLNEPGKARAVLHIVSPQPWWSFLCKPRRQLSVNVSSLQYEATSPDGKTHIFSAQLLNGGSLVQNYKQQLAGLVRSRIPRWLRTYVAADRVVRVEWSLEEDCGALLLPAAA